MLLALLRRSAPAPDPDHIAIDHEGATFRILLRRRDSARRLTLRVSAATGEVVMTVPPRTALATAQRFAAGHGGWIAARLAKLPERVAFAEGALFPLRGVMHAIVRREGRSGATRIEAGPDGPVLSVSCGEAHVARRAREFLQAEALRDLKLSIAHHTERLGQGPARITLRDTRSRWGSCTARGELNFSWRLILAPPLVLDYLVAHEMAHLREMNHSDRFWRLVGELCPNVDAAEAWLKRHGAGLHRYG